MNTQIKYLQDKWKKEEELKTLDSKIDLIKRNMAELENQLSILRNELDKCESERLRIVFK